MKRHIRDFVRLCLKCQRVKVEHQRPMIHATAGVRNQQNLYPRIPTTVAKLLQYSSLRSNSGMGFLHAK